MKYPIGIQTFEQIIMDGYIYVDKTDLIYSLVTRGKYTFSAARDDLGKAFCYLRWKIIFRVEKTCLRG